MSDVLAVVIDWLDCGRAEDLEGLVDLYADNAVIRCGCTGKTSSGRKEIRNYWRPRVGVMDSKAFLIETVEYMGDCGAMLEYFNAEGKLVHIEFSFDGDKIVETRCGPKAKRDDAAAGSTSNASASGDTDPSSLRPGGDGAISLVDQVVEVLIERVTQRLSRQYAEDEIARALPAIRDYVEDQFRAGEVREDVLARDLAAYLSRPNRPLLN